MKPKKLVVFYFIDGRWAPWRYDGGSTVRTYGDRNAAVNACRALLMGDDDYEPVEAVSIRELNTDQIKALKNKRNDT